MQAVAAVAAVAVVLIRRIHLEFAEVREKYPQYSDLSDQQLADALHKKFYADLPFDAFSKKIGYSPEEIAKRTPKQMLGEAGREKAMQQVLEEHPIAGRFAAVGAVPRQLYEGAKQRLGFGDPEAIQATRTMEQTYPGAALAGGVATAGLTSLIPGAGGIAGQTTLGALTGALAPTMGNESVLGNIALGGAAGAAGGAVMKGVGALGQKLFQRSAQKAAEQESAHAVRDKTLQDARALGLVVPRSATGQANALDHLLESVGGKAAIGQQASKDNQLLLNQAAKEEASLLPGEHLQEKDLKAARKRLAEPYREVAATSPRAAQALDRLEEARQDAKDNWKTYQQQGGSANRKLAMADDAKAEAYEKLIDSEAKAKNNPDLLKRLRDARIALAKNHDIQKSLIEGSGNVDAAQFAKMLKQRGSAALTDKLDTMARFAQAFPVFSRAAPSGQVAPGVNALKPYAAMLGAGLAGVGAGHVGEHYGLPLSPYMMGAAALTLPMMGGAARSIALSRMMQSAPQYVPSLASRMAGAIAGRVPQATLPLSAVGAGLIGRTLPAQEGQ
jgi:hypothetical protein